MTKSLATEFIKEYPSMEFFCEKHLIESNFLMKKQLEAFWQKALEVSGLEYDPENDTVDTNVPAIYFVSFLVCFKNNSYMI